MFTSGSIPAQFSVNSSESWMQLLQKKSQRKQMNKQTKKPNYAFFFFLTDSRITTIVRWAMRQIKNLIQVMSGQTLDGFLGMICSWPMHFESDQQTCLLNEDLYITTENLYANVVVFQVAKSRWLGEKQNNQILCYCISGTHPIK